MKAKWSSESSMMGGTLTCSLALLFSTSCLAQYTTLGPASCGGDKSGCHASEFKNQIDKHKNSLDDMSSDDAKKYANIPGADGASILKGTSKCMSCHGTAITAKGDAEVEDGVSCESCHGPGSGYRDLHSQKGNYENAVKAGMRDLRKLDVRAMTCVRCHLTTDQNLAAAGHPSGLKFNYVSNIKSVAKHWKRALADPDKDRKPFEDAVKARGPLPEVTSPAAQTAGESGSSPGKVVRDQQASNRQTTSKTRPGQAVPAGPNALSTPLSVGPITLEPFPPLSDTASVDSILLVLKKRLELLYQKINPAPKK